MIKIVSDSSSNIFTLPGDLYSTVPMKIITAEKEYIDTPDLDVAGMVADLAAYKGKSGSSCANAQEWLDAFQGADTVYGVTISKYLSGSYNAAQQAAADYMAANPGAKVVILDSLSAGPEQMMLVEKLRELVEAGLSHEEVVEKARDYQNHTHILFCLECMNNLARNGRVSPAAAKIAGLLGIRGVGDAEGGQIISLHKPRGEKKAIATLVEMMAERGMTDGNLIRIAHCQGLRQAENLKAAVLERWPNCRFIIEPTTALCSFYAEVGGLMIGMEGGYNKNNNCFDF